MNPKALIFGINGQDAILLSNFLLKLGYVVYGTTRGLLSNNLKSLKIDDKIIYFTVDIRDRNKVFELIDKVKPDEIYNLAGISSVAESFLYPQLTFDTNLIGTTNILEALKDKHPNTRFFNAGSGDVFGQIEDGSKATEKTCINPVSPYGISKAASYFQVKNYRIAYGLKCCTGILFNHESNFRSNKFVSKKIVSAASRISKGSNEILELGNINISRDWGWAEEYTELMYLMLNNSNIEDIIIATGESHTLEEFVKYSFEIYNLDYRNHIAINEKFIRPTDIKYSCGDPNKANQIYNWKPKIKFYEVINKLSEHEAKIIV